LLQGYQIMIVNRLTRQEQLDLLNHVCPNNRKHKDISSNVFPSGRFEMTCHDCSQNIGNDEKVIYVNPDWNY
jgi:hypothetical protein